MKVSYLEADRDQAPVDTSTPMRRELNIGLVLLDEAGDMAHSVVQSGTCGPCCGCFIGGLGAANWVLNTLS